MQWLRVWVWMPGRSSWSNPVLPYITGVSLNKLLQFSKAQVSHQLGVKWNLPYRSVKSN